MDYDRTSMPETYDRGRKPPDGVLEMWIDRVAAASAGHPILRIVDLGCGTGRFSAPLARRFGAGVLGVDPSEKMLALARAKAMPDGVTFAIGSAEAIPCADASVDLIFMSMVFHHFTSRERAVNECGRALRDGGLVCVRNGTRDRAWPYEDYFPNYRSVLAHMPAAAEIARAFVDAPFHELTHEVVRHTMANSLAELADKATYRADTTLLRLADSDFESGLAAMRAAAPLHLNPVRADIDLFVFQRHSRLNG